jgi:putative SOS response-associated peptidase YedK
MCGRYSLTVPPEELARHFGLSDVPKVEARYNIAPTQDVPVVVSSDGLRTLCSMRWGLVPFSATGPEGPPLINARSETVAEKAAFRWAFRKSRCLIPADGFYEWQSVTGRKQAYHITFKDHRLFAFAGLWDEWSSPEGERVLSCSILTTEPSAEIRPIHDRMPVILRPAHYDEWLEADPDRVDLTPLYAPPRDGVMCATPVGDYVNRTANEGPECVAAPPPLTPPAAAPPAELDLFGE